MRLYANFYDVSSSVILLHILILELMYINQTRLVLLNQANQNLIIVHFMVNDRTLNHANLNFLTVDWICFAFDKIFLKVQYTENNCTLKFVQTCRSKKKKSKMIIKIERHTYKLHSGAIP